MKSDVGECHVEFRQTFWYDCNRITRIRREQTLWEFILIPAIVDLLKS